MREEAVLVLRLDGASVPPEAAKAATALAKVGQAGEASARQTANAMRMLPAQLTDVVTQLQGGANPLTVLIQQGGQVKDMFGGIGPALRGIGAALSPTLIGFGALAAVFGPLALAWKQGADQDKALRDSMILTGNAAGLTSSRLQLAAENVAASTRQSVGAARDIVTTLAASGQVSAKVLDGMAIAVARVAQTSGQDADKIAGDFASMAGGVAKWAAEHNKAWNFIGVEQYKYIRRLEEQGKAEQAMLFVSKRISEQMGEQEKNLGYIEAALDSGKRKWSEWWNAALNVGRPETLRDQLDKVMRELATRGPNQLSDKGRDFLETRVQNLKELVKLEAQQADAQSRTGQANRAAIAKEIASEGKPHEYIGAIRSARELYRADFLRSEKAYYAEAAKAEHADIDRQIDADHAREEAHRVALAELDNYEAHRLMMQRKTLADLALANRRFAIDSLDDESARGDALIKLDQEIARRQLDDLVLSLQARRQAEAMIDDMAAMRRRQLGKSENAGKGIDRQALAEDTAGIYDSFRGAISAALKDSKDPIRTFARTLGNAVRDRLTESIADAWATALVGRNGRGGLFSSLLQSIGGIGGGGITAGGGYTNVTGETFKNAGGMATGTNLVPRDMIVKVHAGEAIVPKQYNPAAGGQAGGAPQFIINGDVGPRTMRAMSLMMANFEARRMMAARY